MTFILINSQELDCSKTDFIAIILSPITKEKMTLAIKDERIKNFSSKELK